MRCRGATLQLPSYVCLAPRVCLWIRRASPLAQTLLPRNNACSRPAGTPWTLAAYAIEGSANKHCIRSKKMMQHNPEVLHAFLAHLSDSLATYVCYQIESGAQARAEATELPCPLRLRMPRF